MANGNKLSQRYVSLLCCFAFSPWKATLASEKHKRLQSSLFSRLAIEIICRVFEQKSETRFSDIIHNPIELYLESRLGGREKGDDRERSMNDSCITRPRAFVRGLPLPFSPIFVDFAAEFLSSTK